jgi:hypothetical protein
MRQSIAVRRRVFAALKKDIESAKQRSLPN